MRAIAITATLVVATGLALAACGSGSSTLTVTRYSSVQQVVAELSKGGLACTDGSNNSPVVSGASSETLCNFTSSDTALIDVFPGTVSNATVLQNSVSTGTEQLWSDVGPNWWVQTSHTYAKRAQAILGGRIVAGPWNPPQAQASQAPAPQDPAVSVCQQFDKIYPNLDAILLADEADPSSLQPDSKLNGYGDQMSHWTYVINQAVDNGTTSASVQFANDLGDAGIATVQVAEPLPGVTPDVQSAIDDVSAVQSDCSAF